MSRTKQTARRTQPSTRAARKGPPKQSRRGAKTAQGGRSGKRLAGGNADDGAQAKRRFRSGTVALRATSKFQRSTGLLLGKLPFLRVVKELVRDLRSESRTHPAAVIAHQDAAEA